MGNDSIFTKIIKREIPAEIIYEDQNHIAFLDINPFEKGHTLVVPKKEHKTIFEMPEEEFLQLQKVIYKLASHIKKTLNSDLNILQNNGKIAGQEVDHVHFHLVPRRTEKKIYNFSSNKEKYLKNEEKLYSRRLKW